MHSEISSPPSSVEPIIVGVNALCSDFRRVEFSHVRRQGNSPAHLLAKHAKGIADFSTWIKENPFFIEQALIHDVITFRILNEILIFASKKKKKK